MELKLDIIFSALADKTRRQILTMLLEDDHAVTDLADPFDMSLAAISKHLKILTQSGLVTQEKRGRVTWCKLEPDAMGEAIRWIESFGTYSATDYDQLEALLSDAKLLESEE